MTSWAPILASPMASSNEDFADFEPGDQLGAMVCVVGAVASLVSLALERYQWDLASYNRFSIATKVPVQVFCVSGPLVLVSACLYSLLALLLLMDGTREVFFVTASWTAICVDMSCVMYDAVGQMLSNWIDVVLHLVNIAILAHTFRQLDFLPSVFIASGSAFWGVVIGIRICRRFREPGGSSQQAPRRHNSMSAML